MGHLWFVLGIAAFILAASCKARKNATETKSFTAEQGEHSYYVRLPPGQGHSPQADLLVYKCDRK